MIVKMLFGSHLYGTETPSSDRDYKGVSLPTFREIALGRIPKHSEYTSTGPKDGKNAPSDVDIEIFSLHEFIKLALEGQTVALDMLHAPKGYAEITSPIWDFLVENRHRFYSKNVSSFVGYAMRQAAKYGVKGSRLAYVQRFLDHLYALPSSQEKLQYFVPSLFPIGEHISYHPTTFAGGHVASIAYFEVCGRQIQVTSTVEYAISVLEKVKQSYGDRAKKAASNDGVDWKALSHALRAAYQMKELFEAGTITFPRPEASYLVAVKSGTISYVEVEAKLEALIAEVKALQAVSTLPEKPDRVFWENFLVEIVYEQFSRRFISGLHVPSWFK